MGNVFVPFNNNPTDVKFSKNATYTVPANKFARVKILSMAGTITMTKSGGSPDTWDFVHGAALSASGSYAGGDPSTHNDLMFTVPAYAAIVVSTLQCTVADKTYKRGTITDNSRSVTYADTGAGSGPATAAVAAGTRIPGGATIYWNHTNVLPPGAGDRSGTFTLSGTYEQIGLGAITQWLSAGDSINVGGLLMIEEYDQPS